VSGIGRSLSLANLIRVIRQAATNLGLAILD
jgi:hypothetical protein